jgi:hypothetical protein
MRSKVEVRAGLAGLHLPTHVHERSFLLQKKERVVLRRPLLLFVVVVLVMHDAADEWAPTASFAVRFWWSDVKGGRLFDFVRVALCSNLIACCFSQGHLGMEHKEPVPTSAPLNNINNCCIVQPQQP